MSKGEEGWKMNKKLAGILAVTLIAVIGGSAAWTMTWTESRITMTAGTASVVSIGLFQDCACTVPLTSHDWGGVVQDQEYEVTAYVRNTGNQAVYITYETSGGEPFVSDGHDDLQGEDLATDRVLGGHIIFDGGQTRFRILVSVLEGPGLPCQLLPTVDPPTESVKQLFDAVGGCPLPLKDPLVCDNGFLLLPGKVIKVDIVLLVDSVVAGGSWSWDFFIAGCAPGSILEG
jgi:hypothetical protein